MTDRTPTTLVDIYEAGGAPVAEDRQSVTLTKPLEPFDIVLRVVPSAFEFGPDGQIMTFSILLHDEMVKTGSSWNWVDYREEIKLPIGQVRLLSKEQENVR